MTTENFNSVEECAQTGCAQLSSSGRYTKFIYNGKTITFLNGKDLVKYISVKKIDSGRLVVDCLGRMKGIYEDYIDLEYILENLYMNPEKFLENLKEVKIVDV